MKDMFIKDAYTRILNGETVCLTKREMSKLDEYCVEINDTIVSDTYVSDEHMGNGVYKVYMV